MEQYSNYNIRKIKRSIRQRRIQIFAACLQIFEKHLIKLIMISYWQNLIGFQAKHEL